MENVSKRLDRLLMYIYFGEMSDVWQVLDVVVDVDYFRW